MSDSDEFDAYDLSEFTEQDFAIIDAQLARAHGGPAVQIAVEDSPFHKFLSWKNYLAVTDLVAPIWCEVQHEYNLYGQHHKPLHLRPSTFTSKTGKRIRVHQQAAHAKDRRLKRGKSVHKALEDELRPEKLVVHVVSEEERFGLRLLRLIDGFKELVSNGITRELPVFAITHAQVVLGVVDEVLLSPLSQPNQDQVVPPTSSTAPCSLSPKSNKWLSSSQITSSPPDAPTTMGIDSGTEPTNNEDLYELCLIDYKTRRSSNIPLDEDSLSSRLQLMMYHRMLSCLLETEEFNFGLLWSRLNLDSTKPFSAQFLKDTRLEQQQVDSSDHTVNLDYLVSEWSSTVRQKRAGLVGVSQQLHIVYRRSVYAGSERDNGKHVATETMDVDDPFAALALQEELDLARAIEESLGEMGHQGAGQIAHHVAQNIKQIGASPFSHTSAVWKQLITPLGSGQTDPALVWAIQESLLSCAHEANARVSKNQPRQIYDDLVSASKQQMKANVSSEISPVIGKKEFRMNDEELDAYVADVLQWWFGARPARGVDVGQTNRCFTCEYQGSCEWREQKAREARTLARTKLWEDSYLSS